MQHEDEGRVYKDAEVRVKMGRRWMVDRIFLACRGLLLVEVGVVVVKVMGTFNYKGGRKAVGEGTGGGEGCYPSPIPLISQHELIGW